MKNPFEKESNAGLITGIALGTSVTAGLAFLFLTKKGSEVSSALKEKAKESAKDIASGFISRKTGVSKTTVKKVANVVA